MIHRNNENVKWGQFFLRDYELWGGCKMHVIICGAHKLEQGQRKVPCNAQGLVMEIRSSWPILYVLYKPCWRKIRARAKREHFYKTLQNTWKMNNH